MWCCLRFWQWIKRQHGNGRSSVGHYHPALTRRTAWPLGRNDIRRHVWRVIGRILRLRGCNEGCEQESSCEAGHPCLRSQANIVDIGPTLGEGDDVIRQFGTIRPSPLLKRWDCAAGDPVGIEPVSTSNSLPAGNFLEKGLRGRSASKTRSASVAYKQIPARRRREFYESGREFYRGNRESCAYP